MMRVLHYCVAGCLFASMILGCSAKDEEPMLCTTFAPTPDDDEGCVNPLLTLGKHPCEEFVAERCTSGSAPNCAASTLADCATTHYLRNDDKDELPSCDPDCPTLPIR
ncbi:MAG: hypothetical protein QM784_24625 [Polyangiaceae bacterium]